VQKKLSFLWLTHFTDLNNFSLKFTLSKVHFKQSSFSGAFAKLRKATIIFAMSVRLSVRVEQLGSHWTDFHEI